MSGIDEAYFELIEEIGTLKSTSEGDDFMKKISEAYGFGDVAYLSLDIPFKGRPKHLMFGTYKEEWRSHYANRRFDKIDPALIRGIQSILPVIWEAKTATSVSERTFFGEAGDFGIGQHGITFPVRGRQGEHAFVTITANERSAEWRSRLKHCMRDFQLLAYHLHQMVLRCEGENIEVIALSPRELECLKWSAAGKSVADIGTILSLSDRTVKFYLDLARHKLECTNITQAVAKAVSRGLVS